MLFRIIDCQHGLSLRHFLDGSLCACNKRTCSLYTGWAALPCEYQDFPLSNSDSTWQCGDVTKSAPFFGTTIHGTYHTTSPYNIQAKKYWEATCAEPLEWLCGAVMRDSAMNSASVDSNDCCRLNSTSGTCVPRTAWLAPLPKRDTGFNLQLCKGEITQNSDQKGTGLF